MIKFNCWLITVAHMLLFTFYVVYIVIVCIVFLALRDFGGRRFISTVLLLLLLLTIQKVEMSHCFKWFLYTERFFIPKNFLPNSDT